MATKRVIELDERTTLDMNDYLLVDSQTSTRKLAMSTLFNYMTLTTMVFVAELPTTDISESTIYLLPHSGSNTQWDEYVYRDGAWVIIGTSTIDLSAIYQTKTDNTLATTSKQIVGAINEVNNDLSKKALVNTYYNSSIDKLYKVNADGTQGNEIKRFKDYTLLASHSGSTTTYTVPNIQNYDELLIVAVASVDGGLRNSASFPIDMVEYNKSNNIVATPDYEMAFNFANATSVSLYTQTSYITIKIYAR